MNIIVSILHPLKYIPLCLHINERQSVDDISIHYIQGEMLLNGISTTISITMLFNNLNNLIYFLPIIFEKIFSFGAILYIAYLKHKYSNNNINDEEIWSIVSSIDENNENNEINEDIWTSVSSIDEDNDLE